MGGARGGCNVVGGVGVVSTIWEDVYVVYWRVQVCVYIYIIIIYIWLCSSNFVLKLLMP